MEKTTKMVQEITRKRKMTTSIKEAINQRIFHNCLLAIGMVASLCFMDIVYIYAKLEVTKLAFKIFPMLFILLTIFTFEVAYRKDNGKIAIVGIEFLVLSILILYLPQIYANLDQRFCMELTFLPILCCIYYIAKSILIYCKTQKEYQNQLSDVKEIVKEEVEGNF